MAGSSSIHISVDDPILFFLWLSNIPLYVCTIPCVYHIFFIHSSVDAHLDCVRVLAIENSAAMNFAVHVFFYIVIFSGYMPSRGVVSSIFSFFKDPPCWLHRYISP